MKKLIYGASLLLFGVGALFAYRESKTTNALSKDINKQVYASNEEEYETESVTVPIVQETTTVYETETYSETETETYTETQTENQTETEPRTEAPTEPQTEVETETQTESADDFYHRLAIINTSTYSQYINEIRILINQERTDAGVNIVSYDSDLDVMACHRAVENAMNNWFKVENGSHIRPNNEKASTICYCYGQYGYFGEVMGRYQKTPAEIVNGWHNSPTHYACMTSVKYTRVGIGVAQDANGNYYWVAIFMN